MEKVVRFDWRKENSENGWVFYHVNLDHLDGLQGRSHRDDENLKLPSNLSFYRYSCWKVSEAFFSLNHIHDVMWHLKFQGLEPSLQETAEMLINRDPRCY